MNQRNSNIRVMATLIYTVIVGIAILTLAIMESTLLNSVVTLLLSFSIVVIYGVSRGVFPKILVIILVGVNIATIISALIEIVQFI